MTLAKESAHPVAPFVPEKIESNTNAAVKDAVASVFGSMLAVYTGQPLDTIKVRMQTRPDAYSSVFQCLRRTLAEESVRSLWKGSVPALSGSISENIVAFGVNKQLKRLFPDEEGLAAPWWQPIAFGGITGLFTSTILCPSDVIKCKVQVGRSLRFQSSATGTSVTAAAAGVGAGAKETVGLPVLNAAQMAEHVLRTQGFRGLFVGLGAQFVRDVPYYAALFGTYETIVNKGKSLPYDVPLEPLYVFAGGMAGVVGWAICMPIDSAKSIIQTSTKPDTLLRTIQKVRETKGWRALFTGLNAALIRAFPANAALFLGYEVVRRVL